MSQLPKADFSIVIDFDKNSPNPSRVFRSMTMLIEAFEQLDKDLAKHIDNNIETVLLLEDIEKGSIRTWLLNQIKKVPDSAIEELSWKKMLGHYLLRGKYILLNALEGKLTISDNAREIEVIEMELKKAANDTGVDQLPTYVPVNRKVIINNIDRISKSLKPLSETDKFRYESEYGSASFEVGFSVDIEKMEDLITNEKIESESKMILKVKKPDYLGESKWEFKHGQKSIYARISDVEWLSRFQNREEDVRPQDSLVCEVKITVKYDQSYEVISEAYEVTKVIKVNERPGSQIQLGI